MTFVQTIRSAIYVVQVFAMMAVMGIVFAPFAIFSRRAARLACHTWAAYAMWTLGLICGLRTEIRGEVPHDPVLVCAKHQSFLDILMIYHALPRAKFIMKHQLIYAPVIGQFALKIGCIPVKRGRRGAAVRQMLDEVAAGQRQPGQLVIYPQGTRVPPGQPAPYKAGSGALYQQMGQPCVPVATNAGAFWARRGMMKLPGLAVVEFLPRIEQGLDVPGFMAQLETEIEEASNALLSEVRTTER